MVEIYIEHVKNFCQNTAGILFKGFYKEALNLQKQLKEILGGPDRL